MCTDPLSLKFAMAVFLFIYLFLVQSATHFGEGNHSDKEQEIHWQVKEEGKEIATLSSSFNTSAFSWAAC